MKILDNIFLTIEKNTWTWIGRQLHKITLYRDSHPAVSLLFLPLDIIFLTIVFVLPTLLVFVLAGLISWPIRWFGGSEVEVLLFGLTVIGVAAIFITRHINQKRQQP